VTPCTYPAEAKTKRSSQTEGSEDRAPFQPRELAGHVVRRRNVAGLSVAEHLYTGPIAIPKHVHRYALLTFVIEGTFREQRGGECVVCREGMVQFLPAGEMHADEFKGEVRCLHVSMGREALEGLDRRSVLPRRPAESCGLTATWLANRLYAEFSRADKASDIAMEGLVLEILAEIARSQSVASTVLVPLWLRQATDIVESRFLERLTLADIAHEVGVHYVHLSRQFHKYNKCTIGELIRKRRIQYASHLLAHSETPLAEIALICGFSDQSHLSFLFKRYMGISPSKFRALAGVRREPHPMGKAGVGAAGSGAA